MDEVRMVDTRDATAMNDINAQYMHISRSYGLSKKHQQKLANIFDLIQEKMVQGGQAT